MRFLIIAFIQSMTIFIFSNPTLLPGNDEPGVWVRAEGFRLERSEIEEAAASRLREVELEALRAPARIRMRQHEILSETMKNLASEKLLRLEAETRGISVEELAETEIKSRIAPLTDDELEKLYELNKNRLQGTRDEILAQITSYMSAQREKQAREEYTDELAKKQGVEYLIPPVRFDISTKGNPSFGPANAPVTIIEFSDFECPHCAGAGKELHRLQLEFEGKVRIVFRQYPLWMIHDKAQKAAEASLCAAEQDKFWEMHNLLFSGQDSLDVRGLKEKAAQLELEQDEFDACLDSGKFSAAVERDLVEGSKAGVSAVPAFFVNGRPLAGRFSYENIRGLVMEELKLQESVD